MAKSDVRYLQRRHQTWYFVTAIPRRLRGRFISPGRNGRPGRSLGKIVVSLQTQSLADAQDKRWPLVNQWRENFKRALSGAPSLSNLTRNIALGSSSVTVPLNSMTSSFATFPPFNCCNKAAGAQKLKGETRN